MPLVSIALPTCDGESYLRESLDSLLNQTFTDLEIVMVDDSSTDGTLSIGEEYSRRDKRIVVHQNRKRLGLVGNFNRTVSLSRGKYVCVWGQDDVMMPDNLARKVEILEAHNQVGFVHSNIYQIDSLGQALAEHWLADSRRDYLCGGLDFFHKMVGGENHVCCHSALARKECFDRLGGFHNKLFYACDWEMWMRVSLYYDVACIGEPLIKYRRHPSTVTSKLLRTPANIEQEFLAKKIVLSCQGKRIPNVAHLRSKVMRLLAEKQLATAVSAYYENDFERSWGFWRLAVKIYPPILTTRKWLKHLVRLSAGKPGATIHRKIKEVFRAGQ